METRNCKCCSKEFIPRDGRQKYCEAECRLRYHSAQALLKPHMEFGEGLCPHCGKAYKRKFYNNIYCSKSCLNQVNTNRAKEERRKNNEKKSKSRESKTCCGCSCIFTPLSNYRKYCSNECGRKFRDRMSGPKRNKHGNKRNKRYKQMLENGDYDNSISIKGLIQKYGDKCRICNKAVDKSDFKIRDRAFIVGANYPSIDHIKPISKGGTHTWDNVQLAHMDCNMKKSNDTTYRTQTGQMKLSV